MRRQSNRLTVTAIKAALRRAPAEGKLLLPDGHGLYLQVKNRVPSWIYRYALNGRNGSMGLGGLDQVSLAAAREKAEDTRRLKRRGIDPLAHRRADRQAQAVTVAKAIPSFAECAQRYVAAKRAGWGSAKHAAQWSATLEAFVLPVFGKLPVDSIDTGLVLRALEPIWQSKPVTAGRVRARIENVLDWATAAKYRTGDNPARWQGQLEHLLANPNALRPVQHHPALKHAEIGEFMLKLRRQEGVAARALEFTILTATRTGEATGARWSEIDVARRLWTIPAERMKSGRKTGREHRVPLSAPALAVIEQMAAIRDGDLVFPSSRSGRLLASRAMLAVLHRLGHPGLVVHGFRSTFRDWAAERTSFPAEICEMALAHAVGDKTEAAYRRSDLFEKRHQLAEAWASYCGQPAAPAAHENVIAIGAR